MAGDGLGWSDSGFKYDNVFMISNTLFYGTQFVDDFLVTVGFFNSGYRPGSVGDDDGSLVEVLVWTEAVKAGQIEGRKMVALCCKIGLADRFWAAGGATLVSGLLPLLPSHLSFLTSSPSTFL